MNSVSTHGVGAAHHAKKHAKSSTAEMPGAEGGDFGGVFASLQGGMEGQDLAAPTGKTSPPAEGLASQILGPSVHIITSETPTLSDDSLYAFARAQGMDESALALIFQRGPTQVPGDPIPTDASVLAVGQAAQTVITEDVPGDALLLTQQRLALQGAAPLPDATTAKLTPSDTAASDNAASTQTALPQPTTDAEGMSTLDLGPEATLRWSVSQTGAVSEGAKPTPPTPPLLAPAADHAAKIAAEASQAAATTGTAAHEEREAPGRELVATLVLGETESRQFAKKLEGKQMSLRAERLGSISSDAFKSALLGSERTLDATTPEAPVLQDSLSLGMDLTGQDLHMIWAHRQAVTEQQGQSQAQNPTTTPQSDIDLRAEQYEKLSQRLGEALGQRLAAQIARGVWKVELALKPQDLGNVEIKLDMKDGALEASFKATEAMTRDLITDGLPRLRDALAQSGMEVAQLNVNVRQDSQNGGNPTPGRHKAPAGISGVSKGALAKASQPADSMATGTRRAAERNGLDILV